MKRLAALAAVLVVGGVAVGLRVSSGTPAQRDRSAGVRGGASLLSLTCRDSAGQQGRGGETLVGGVEGLVLPGSGDPAGLYPIRGAGDKRYFVYKAFLAVAAASAPYAVVSIVRPADATLYYGPAGKVGALVSTAGGRPLVAASRSRVRLSVCGPRFTGYVGGIVVAGPTWVTFAVSSPHHRTVRVRIPIGVS